METPTKCVLTACNVAHAPGARAILRGFEQHHPEVARYCAVPIGEQEAVAREIGELATIITPVREVATIPKELQACVLRLCLGDLKEDVALYIDADTVLCHPVPEYFDVAPGKINAVPDVSHKILDNVPTDLRQMFEHQFPKRCMEKGMNAGVFALRPADFRDIRSIFEDAFARGAYHYYPPIFDQPLLNALFLEKIDWLPYEFNVHELNLRPIPKQARIVHFTGGPKPWMPSYQAHNPGYYYWKKHGLREQSTMRLLATRAWIAIQKPRRVLHRWYCHPG
jgi:lipopolysaccharide biosynthesis glycosyltransferase